MQSINGYEILSDAPIATSSAVYWKARKNDEYFFLKRFNDPSRPSDRVSAAEILRRNGLCDRFEEERTSVNSVIRRLGGGNFVAPVDFFAHERRYYQATPWRQIEKKSIAEIVRLGDKEKLLILKTAANCLKLLHEHGIVHCDIKPDNLPVTVTKNQTLTCSLIDFDTAHLEDRIPSPDEVFVTDPFMSPELAAYKMGKRYYGDHTFTVKSDVFAMAIVFHYYWSGKSFIYKEPARGPYLYNAVLEDIPVSVADNVPVWLKDLLLKMIDRQPENRPTMSQVLEYLKGVNPESAPVEDKPAPPKEQPAEPKQQTDGRYSKGANFPEDAVSFQVLPNNNVKFVYDDGSRIALNINVALKRQYIKENCGDR